MDTPTHENETIRTTPEEIQAKISEMNQSRLAFENAQTREEKDRADQTFNACYDWLSRRRIPFQFNNGTWELAGQIK